MMMGTLLFMYQDYNSGNANTNNGILLLSRDSGMSWDTVRVDSAGIPEFVVAAATDGKDLFIGGVDSRFFNGRHITNGVYFSTDTGRTWHVANQGLGTDLDIEAIGVTFDTMLNVSVRESFPFATYHRPIREMTDSTKSGVHVAALPRDTVSVFPNPTTGIVTVIAGNTAILGVRVLNVLGTEVSSIEHRAPREVTFDLSELPSGTYFIAIETINGIVLRKMVKE